MSDILKFSIPGKPEYVQMVRLAIASIAGKADFDVDAASDIKEAVAEACKIVFCHGAEGFSDGYEIICEISETNMVITASDACSGRARSKSKGLKQCDKCPEEGNVAVAVMETLMDSVEVSLNPDGNKIIKMVKNK
jgi:serine/threonine-protein kinase RsbW